MKNRVFYLFTLLIFMSCSVDMDPLPLKGIPGTDGAQGPKGDKGDPGEDAFVYSSTILPSDDYPNGGTFVTNYHDDDGVKGYSEGDTIMSTYIIKNGTNGLDGQSSSIVANRIDGGVTITVTTGDDVQTVTIYDGEDGIDGLNGSDGADGKDGKNGLSIFKDKCNIWMCNGSTTKVVPLQSVFGKMQSGWLLGKCNGCSTCPQ